MISYIKTWNIAEKGTAILSKMLVTEIKLHYTYHLGVT